MLSKWYKFFSFSIPNRSNIRLILIANLLPPFELYSAFNRSDRHIKLDQLRILPGLIHMCWSLRQTFAVVCCVKTIRTFQLEAWTISIHWAEKSRKTQVYTEWQIQYTHQNLLKIKSLHLYCLKVKKLGSFLDNECWKFNYHVKGNVEDPMFSIDKEYQNKFETIGGIVL